MQHANKTEVISLSGTHAVAFTFAEQLKAGDIVALCGDLGAGKTEFVKAICDKLNVNEVVTSPSFTLINQYECPVFTIFHIDLYRISKQEELLQIGLHELLDTSNSIFFIEWPENSFNTLPYITYTIQITHTTHQTRTIEIISHSK